MKGDLKDGVKAYVLQVLKEQYDFEEEDFLSAELEIVPAGAARELGFDRSMIIGYWIKFVVLLMVRYDPWLPILLP